MQDQDKLNDKIQEIKGTYKFRSPYHKAKKMLPFIILGHSYNEQFPVKCSTVAYRGWTKEKVTSDYKIESLEKDIETGFLIKTNPQPQHI